MSFILIYSHSYYLFLCYPPPWLTFYSGLIKFCLSPERCPLRFASYNRSIVNRNWNKGENQRIHVTYRNNMSHSYSSLKHELTSKKWVFRLWWSCLNSWAKVMVLGSNTLICSWSIMDRKSSDTSQCSLSLH